MVADKTEMKLQGGFERVEILTDPVVVGFLCIVKVLRRWFSHNCQAVFNGSSNRCNGQLLRQFSVIVSKSDIRNTRHQGDIWFFDRSYRPLEHAILRTKVDGGHK